MSEEETQVRDAQQCMPTVQQTSTVTEETGGPVSCLGLSFVSDAERREYFTECLREKLADPTFRTQEGFPIGSDEDILALSNPPYYTACPNPFLEDFVRCYGAQYDANVPYHREPLAVDVSEGKNDPVYNAYTYHTKVPYKAIMRYLLHYTRPGDLVLDGFCGSGMTGVAAQMCGDPDIELKAQIESEWNNAGLDAPKWGLRRSILIDLSPAATFIASNYVTSFDRTMFLAAARQVLADVENDLGWMYETKHAIGNVQHFDISGNQIIGHVNYIVWSDVFVCPNCGGEVNFFHAAMNPASGTVLNDFPCPHCNSRLSKQMMERSQETYFDNDISEVAKRGKQVPVLINYSVGTRRFNKTPSLEDISISDAIEHTPAHWFPVVRIDKDIDLWFERDYRSIGVYAIHHFFTSRNLRMLAALWEKSESILDLSSRARFRSALLAMQVNLSRMNRYRPAVSFPYNPLSGTLYIGSVPVESNVLDGVRKKVKRLANTVTAWRNDATIIATQSSVSMAQLTSNCIDYIFVDPPFGSNIIYSDLSIIWESWLRVLTNVDEEAVIHRRKHVGAHTMADYLRLMAASFSSMYRVLKPGRWITIEFHNTKNSVWAAIQEALLRSGFVIADVRILDKQQRSFKQITAAGAVKQDLVISAYKPDSWLDDHFSLEAGTEEGVWDFVRTHLKQLPVFVPAHEGRAEVIAERLDYLLFDRMVAFHVQRGVAVPLSAPEFYAGLRQRFPQRDEMFFLEEQVAEYERKRLSVREIQQLTIFVKDEATAIQWLRQQLGNKTQTRAELTPQFMRELGAWDKHEKLPEMIELLEQNFLHYDGEGPIPAQIVGWMRKSSELRELIEQEIDAGKLWEDGGLETREFRLLAHARDHWYVPDPNKLIDLEKLRTRTLLREFATYTEGRGKLKLFRTEAVRAGFAALWRERDYITITRVAERLPELVLQEDPDLLMYYDTASLRVRP